MINYLCSTANDKRVRVFDRAETNLVSLVVVVVDLDLNLDGVPALIHMMLRCCVNQQASSLQLR